MLHERYIQASKLKMSEHQKRFELRNDISVRCDTGLCSRCNASEPSFLLWSFKHQSHAIQI